MSTPVKHGDIVSGLTDSYEYVTRVWVLRVDGTPSARRVAETHGEMSEVFQAQRIEVLGTGPSSGHVEHLRVEVHGSLGKHVRSAHRYVCRVFFSDDKGNHSHLFSDAPQFVLDILRENIDLPILHPADEDDHAGCDH